MGRQKHKGIGTMRQVLMYLYSPNYGHSFKTITSYLSPLWSEHDPL